MNDAAPPNPADAGIGSGSSPAAAPRGQVVVLHEPRSGAAERVAQVLEQELQKQGYRAFVDRSPRTGLDWAREITREIRQADAVVPLLSVESVASEVMGFLVETADEACRSHRGRPGLLPVRVQYTGPLPEPLAGILSALPYQVWERDHDTDGLIAELLDGVRHLPSGDPPTTLIPLPKGVRMTRKATVETNPTRSVLLAGATVSPEAEQPSGAVPLGSPYYVTRNADAELEDSLGNYHSIILIKGARQMGKTSLLARGLQQARTTGARVTLTDFQEFSTENLENTTALYMTLAESLADQLGLGVLPSEVWDARRGPNVNFDRFLRREVLAKLDTPLVWGMDEVDRLLVTHYASEVFGLFRAWHNQRALDPAGPWSRLSVVISYATEAHLFISDPNQSPFNVGTRIVLEDFTVEQAASLNRKYGMPLKNPGELDRFIRLVGGHPYLVRRGLHEIAYRKMDLDTFEARASSDDGLFADHLRRILILLARDPELTEVVRETLTGSSSTTPENFYRLRSAGVMSGVAAEDMHPRCQIYATYLRRHLR